MSHHLRRLLAGLMPAGLLGLSSALAQPAEAAVLVRHPEVSAADVATRLATVRAAVTDTLAAVDAEPAAGVQRVWWGNHGWGRPWRWGWGNGGWRNGGWGNGGGWRNGGWGNWHPWGNGGWGNWHP